MVMVLERVDGSVGLCALGEWSWQCAAGCVANLVHGEAALGDDLLKGDTLAAVAEVFVGSAQSEAVFPGQFLVIAILIVNDDFERINHGCEFVGVQLADQLESFGFEFFNCH